MNQLYMKYKKKLAYTYIEWNMREKVECWFLGNVMDTFLSFMEEKVNRDTVIADIGSGKGYYTLKMLKQFPLKKIYCLDRSQKSLQYIKDKADKLGHYDKVQTVCGDINHMELEHNCADIVMCNTLLHEFERPEEILQNMKDLIRNKGYLIIIDFNDTWLGRFAGRGYTDNAHGAFTVKSLEMAFRAVGLKCCRLVSSKHLIMCIGRKE